MLQMQSLQTTVALLITPLNAGHNPRDPADSPLRQEDTDFEEEDEFSEVEVSVSESASPFASPQENKIFGVLDRCHLSPAYLQALSFTRLRLREIQPRS